MALDRRIGHARDRRRVLLARVGGVAALSAHDGTARTASAIAAIAMWTVWVIAYLMAMAQNTWYTGFRHVARRLFSFATDQQVTTALMWFITACAFLADHLREPQSMAAV